MATTARRIYKVLLFIGLFTFSVKYVHTYPQPMTEGQLDLLLGICERFGIHDPDDLYIPATMVVELIVTIIVYAAMMKLWKIYQAARPQKSGQI
jgi:hypothetical protein